jgi:MSHA biogenesis protein MshM
MYRAFFGLQQIPFSLTPDTDFFYAFASHQEAFNTLWLALRSGEGFIKITGEVGTGKTLLCRKLLDSLDAGYVTAWLPNPQLTDKALRYAVAEELGLDLPHNIGQHRLLKALQAHLIRLHAEGKKVVLLIDEAQALPEESLEAVRLLTNLETRKHKLLQVVMLGQPELDRALQRPAIRQLKQRIGFSYRLQPLDRAATEDYVLHRLRKAGYAGPPLFTRGAVRALYRASAGIPRLVNILSHKTLMLAFGKGRRRITRTLVISAIRDTEGAHRPRPFWALALLCLLGLTTTWALAAGLLWGLGQ